MIGIGHPRQVHFWKNIVRNLMDDGHDVKIVAWKKDILLDLLNAYGFEYEVIGKNYKGLIKKAYGMFENDIKLFKIAKKFKPDILMGGSPYLAHVSKLIGKPYIYFFETEHAHISYWLTYPFADVICSPSCFKKKINSHKYVTYNSYSHLAYLHPNYFTPDPSVLEDMGLSADDTFIIIRLVLLDASHDARSKGFSNKFLEQSIKLLEEYGNTFITSERKLSKSLEKYRITFPPEKLHSALYYASLHVGDGGTAIESAILGTPSVHVISVKSPSGEMLGASQIHGIFDELVNRYGMLYSYTDPNRAIDKALEILQCDDIKIKLKGKKRKLLNDKIDTTTFMTEFIEKYPESFYECRER